MRYVLFSVICVGTLNFTELSHAQETAADILPDSTAIYLEISQPTKLLAEIKDHPLLREIKQSDIGEKLLTNTDFVQFQVVLSFLELRLGMTWEEAVAALTSGGIALGVDPATDGVALILKGESAEQVEELRKVMMELVREEAAKKGEPDPYQTMEYRGVTAYQTKEGGFATHGQWLLTANKGELGKKLIDQLLDGGEHNLAHNAQFLAARQRPQDHDFWGFVNLSQLREREDVKQKIFGHTENPLAELLVGGLQEVLRHSPYLTLNANLYPDHFDLDASVPHDPANIAESREYWFGSDGVGSADPLPQIEDQLFSLTSYRDISEMWLRAGDLFDERMNDQLAEADSTLTTLFAGKDFGEDVLGEFHPQLQLVVTRQTFPREGLQPAIKLPAFGLLFHMQNPEKGARELRRTYQSLIGFLNIVGAMNGQPQLELNFENSDGVDLISASYIPEPGEEHSQTAPINFNFSPTVAFFGDRFTLASTSKLARMMVTAKPQDDGGGANPVHNTIAVLSSHALSAALDDNRSQLIAQNMLEEGNTQEEAEGNISMILELLGMINGAKLDVSTNVESKTFDLHFGIH